MQHEELISRAVELVKTIPYLNLASSKDGRPWSTPVYAVYDSDLHFYWSSWKGATHSLNFASNPAAAFTIYDSTRPRGTNNYRCLYVECSVQIVAGKEEAEKTFKLLYPTDPVSLNDFLEDGLKRFYRATPIKAWLNSLSERQLTPTTIKMRDEVDVPALRAAI